MNWRDTQKLNPFLRGLLVWSLSIVAGGMAYAQPELNVQAQEQTAHPRQVYRIVCEVSWTGDPAAYAILPAEVDPIDWGTLTVRAVTTTVREATNVVSQTLEIVPARPGEFKVPSIKIAYLHPEEISLPETTASRTDPPARGTSPMLASDPFTLRVQPDRTLAWVFGGLGVFFLTVGLGWWFARPTRKPQPGPAPTDATIDVAQAEMLLQSARPRRIDGDYYHFYVELARAAQVVSAGTAGSELGARLAARASDIGYRGLRPSEDEMDGDVRALERALKQLKEEMQR